MNLRYKFHTLLLICLTQIQIAYSQANNRSDWGGMLGFTFGLGTITRQVGLVGGAYYHYDWIQVNTKIRAHYNFSTLGPPLKGMELQASLGLVFAFGKYDSLENKFLSPLSNQTGRKNSFGYAYNIYLDKINTSQSTGSIALQVHRFQMIIENDILAWKGTDKYRTGAFLLAYRLEDSQIAINSTLWTGDPSRNANLVRNSDYPGRYGYKNLSESPYGKLSHGLFSIQWQQILPYRQQFQMNIGVDSEHVRHFVQNKLIHDMYFVPGKWNKAHNPHYPMLDTEGMPFLFLENQKVKPTRPYIHMALNPGVFY